MFSGTIPKEKKTLVTEKVAYRQPLLSVVKYKVSVNTKIATFIQRIHLYDLEKIPSSQFF